ncbi:hypothetical protein LWT02_09300 [Enterobacter bugandensis]|uniref:hypothetical protein n=1 Tax=Enterobacter bugandensis TaxID=881260 RepID=UPI001E2C5584|nr:hypothetical protein [Enterobacter bugandensis]MCE1957031.1 hypothetical protein [Enterobacter bugandensis]
MSVKRYDIGTFGGMSMELSSDGAYVRHDDYAALETRCAEMASENAGLAEAGNSPVIPDGWVAVPVEPTEDMIVNGFESDERFSDAEEWEAYEAMSGCQQAAHRAKLCWAAMLNATPKP